ncbi:ubiquinone biosynthesis monooxygenase COQ6, mitochondrial-like [Ornithodoros turicata]|uniref:ubiquinone biosynthesis monooxygenase COQ6, mitochondrial-like n=1 Tax=Ornithodoros turicata TaxID=34597 RepID=UPI00313863DC
MRSTLFLMRTPGIRGLWFSTCARTRCSQTVAERYDSDSDSEAETRVLTKHKWDVVISGAGLAGAALACALGTSEVFAGKKVLLIERRTLRTEHEGNGWSNRVYALTPGSKTFLEELGVWKLLPKSKMQAVNRMQVWESHSEAAITFDAVTPDGVVAYDVDLPNLMDALYKRLSQLPGVRVCSRVRVADYQLPTLERKNLGDSCPPVKVRLQDGSCFEASMLVGADGFNSQVKKAMGVKSLQWNYNQKSIIATLQLAESVDNSIAWQRFLPHGVVALLPLDSEHTSLVWSLRADLADKLMKMDEDSFVDALNHSLSGAGKRNSIVDSVMSGVSSTLKAVGLAPPGMQLPMRILRVTPGSRATFPLGMSHATYYVLPRVALIGDAAHRIHPMAGQGANLGIGDAQGLAELLIKSVQDGNSIVPFDALLEYETQMQRHNVPFLCAVEALVYLYQMNVAPVVLARSIGLQVLNSLTGIKDWITHRASY